MTRGTKAAAPAEIEPGAVLKRYGRWLARQPLADRSRDAYLVEPRRRRCGGACGVVVPGLEPVAIGRGLVHASAGR